MRVACLVLVLVAGSAHAQEVRGLLPAEVIRRVVHRQAGASLRRCYRERREIVPTLAGRWTVRLVIAADGHVVSASVEPTGASDDVLEACAAAALRPLTFPSGGGITHVTWAFDFSPPAPRPRGPPRVRPGDRGPYVVRP